MHQTFRLGVIMKDLRSFRKNCEGYFIDNNGNILAYNKGMIIFPGGGIEEGELPDKAIIREAYEETGAIIEKVVKLGVCKIKWGSNWAKTEKQKERYKEFQGDEMHFFKGIIKRFDANVSEEEDFWKGKKLMPIKDVIKIIENYNNQKEYRNLQLKFLKEILN